MKIDKAVITAAAPYQRSLPLQTLADREGKEKTLLHILIDEILAAQIEEICVVVRPGDEEALRQAAGEHARLIQFVTQGEPRGYAQAIRLARSFTKDDAFLHLVGDHVYVNRNGSFAKELVAVAELEGSSVSAVQATREHLLGRYGAVGGQRLAARPDLYRVEHVLEKPTPTEAEQHILVSGLRAGYYLCFFGMHVLTPRLMDILDRQLTEGKQRVTLSSALAELAQNEQYLALETSGRRYDLGVKYGLLTAQLAVGLNGRDRDEILGQILELLATQQLNAAQN